MKRQTKYDREKRWVRKAEKNGIKKEYFIQRIEQYGWSIKDACTVPVGEKRRKKA